MALCRGTGVAVGRELSHMVRRVRGTGKGLCEMLYTKDGLGGRVLLSAPRKSSLRVVWSAPLFW